MNGTQLNNATEPRSVDQQQACYALGDTRIEVAGVMRCCLATVAKEYQGKDGPEGDQQVTLGMKSKCRHCNQSFTLVEAKPHPKWKPDWQLDGHNDEAHRRTTANQSTQNTTQDEAED